MLGNFKGSKAFLKEINDWLDENIINEQQAQILIQRYELEKNAPWYLRSSFILRALALVLVLMGFVLIISVNWNQLPLVIRMLTGVIPLGLSFYMVFFYLQKEDRDALELASFAAAILFGINIFLQAQIFNISAHFPDGFLWFLIGALPLALYLRSHILGMVLQLVFLAWLDLEVYSYGVHWMAPVFMGAFIYLLYQKNNRLALSLNIFTLYYFLIYLSTGLAQEMTGTYVDFYQHLRHIPNLINFGLIYVLILDVLREPYPEKFSNRLKNSIHFLIGTCLFVYTFPLDTGAQLYPLAIFLFLGLLGLLYYQRAQLEFNTLLSLGIVILIMIFKGAAFALDNENSAFYKFLLAQKMNPGALFDTVEILRRLVFNAAFLAYAILKINYGIRKRIKTPFMTGISYLVILAVARYLDLFADYLTMALIFIICGLGVFFMNNLWNKKYARQ